jgi:hypothetical protein
VEVFFEEIICKKVIVLKKGLSFARFGHLDLFNKVVKKKLGFGSYIS